MGCPIAKYGVKFNELIVGYNVQNGIEVYMTSFSDYKIFLKNIVLQRMGYKYQCVDISEITQNPYIIKVRSSYRNNIQTIWKSKSNLSIDNLHNFAVINKIGIDCANIEPIRSNILSFSETFLIYSNTYSTNLEDNPFQENNTPNISPILYTYFSQLGFLNNNNLNFYLKNKNTNLNLTNWETEQFEYISFINSPSQNFLFSEQLTYDKNKRQLINTIFLPSYDNTDFIDLDTILQNL